MNKFIQDTIHVTHLDPLLTSRWSEEFFADFVAKEECKVPGISPQPCASESLKEAQWAIRCTMFFVTCHGPLRKNYMINHLSRNYWKSVTAVFYKLIILASRAKNTQASGLFAPKM